MLRTNVFVLFDAGEIPTPFFCWCCCFALLCFALFNAREIPTHNVFYFVLFCSLSKTNECCLIMD